jgi:hypothetical protein
MPYITQDKRDVLDPAINQLHKALVDLELDHDTNNTQGNMNYAVTRLLMMVYGGVNYQNINDAVGVLDCCKMEFYRKIAAPYEDQKCFENGSVDAELTSVYTKEIVIEKPQ